MMQFRLRAFFYVEPANAAPTVAEDIRELFASDHELRELTPIVDSASDTGKIDLELQFAADDGAAAEAFADRALQTIMGALRAKHEHNGVRESSNLLSFA